MKAFILVITMVFTCNAMSLIEIIIAAQISSGVTVKLNTLSDQEKLTLKNNLAGHLYNEIDGVELINGEIKGVIPGKQLHVLTIDESNENLFGAPTLVCRNPKTFGGDELFPVEGKSKIGGKITFSTITYTFDKSVFECKIRFKNSILKTSPLIETLVASFNSDARIIEYSMDSDLISNEKEDPEIDPILEGKKSSLDQANVDYQLTENYNHSFVIDLSSLEWQPNSVMIAVQATSNEALFGQIEIDGEVFELKDYYSQFQIPIESLNSISANLSNLNQAVNVKWWAQ